MLALSMDRIVVIGCSGSGKSTFARHLSAALRLPLFHLDREYWTPGWKPLTHVQFKQRIDAILLQPNWIIDGNYNATLEPRLERADTVIHFDFPRWRSILGVARRVIKSKLFNHDRPDMAHGCPEHWDWEFIEWIWNFNTTNRPKNLLLLKKHASHLNIHTFATPRHVHRFLHQLPHVPTEMKIPPTSPKLPPT